jgi:anti-sigma B factor antagonist
VHRCAAGRFGRRGGEKEATATVELQVRTTRSNDVCVVTAAGEVDVYTSPTLKQALLEAAEGGCGVLVVDMDEVGFIDSSGLGVLVGALRRSKEAGGELRISGGSDSVVKIFRITGLDKVFPMYPTLDEAREA